MFVNYLEIAGYGTRFWWLVDWSFVDRKIKIDEWMDRWIRYCMAFISLEGFSTDGFFSGDVRDHRCGPFRLWEKCHHSPFNGPYLFLLLQVALHHIF